jgi:hypothetical protein
VVRKKFNRWMMSSSLMAVKWDFFELFGAEGPCAGDQRLRVGAQSGNAPLRRASRRKTLASSYPAFGSL